MFSVNTLRKLDRAVVFIVAAKLGCDPRTAEKACRLGPDALRNRVHRERAHEVLTELGLGSPEPASVPAA